MCQHARLRLLCEGERADRQRVLNTLPPCYVNVCVSPSVCTMPDVCSSSSVVIRDREQEDTT